MLFKLAFLRFKVEVVFFDFFKHSVDALSVEFEVIFSHNEDVVHVNNKPSFGYFFSEYCIHHCLEGCWGVC